MGGSAVAVASWRWAAASCRGLSHERAGTRLQDAARSFLVHGRLADYFVGIVCDGAGSATFGGQGASLICRSISVAVRRHLATSRATPTREDVEEWVDSARDLIGAVATRRQLLPRDFAATLVCVISDGTTSLVAHVGDGCAVLKDGELQSWVAPTWPYHGEYASTTAFVTDDEGAKLQFVSYAKPIVAVCAFSDGIERLALDFNSQQPFQPFFEGMIRPLLSVDKYGRDSSLSAQLKAYLGSASVNARTDDDKSFVVAVRQ